MVFMNPTLWILISGNLLDGFEFIGPFNSQKDGEQYGKTEFGDEGFEWHVIDLIKPGD